MSKKRWYKKKGGIILKYGYLGPPGTFSEIVALNLTKKLEDLIPYLSISDVIKGVQIGEVERGIIPIENSLEGSVNISMDLLTRENNFRIVSEVIQPVQHFLFAQKGIFIQDIEEVISHYQAIAQSSSFLNKYLSGAKLSYTESTAAAARLVLKNKKKSMIGSERIKNVYGLDIVAENIQDNRDNFTRFFVISNEKINNTSLLRDEENYKTSIVCAPEENRPGILYEILGEFASRNINLTRIESRPIKNKLWEYLFYIDFEGWECNEDIAVTLEKIRFKSAFFKVLGSYSKGLIREGSREKLLKTNIIRKENDEWKKIIRREISGIKPYIPGKAIEEVKREYGLDRIIKMASNENPQGPSKLVRKIMKDAAKQINRYPDADNRSLKEELAKKLDVNKDMLIFGNGSDGLLKVIAETFLNKDSEVIMPYPSFIEYSFISQLMGSNIIRVWMKNYHQDLKGIIRGVSSRTRLVFLTNPHNPAGTIFSKKELEELLDKLPEDIILVLDEAYSEYANNPEYPDGIDYIKKGYPLIILRTFSKAYGLAGLRLGYAVANTEIIANLMKVRDPFNVNYMAEEAGKAALNDRDFINETININEKGKEYLYRELDRLNLPYVPTEANFILINIGMDSMELFYRLLKKGIIIRPGKLLGFQKHIRVSIGTAEENEAFIEALELSLE
jgi:histidinol-phosphate aminotransferase